MRFYEALHPTKPIALAELLGGERWSPDYFRPQYVANELTLEARDDMSTLDGFSKRLTCGPFGSSVPANLFVDSGVPFLRMSNVRAFYLDSSGLVCLPEDEADRLQAANFAPGDLVISKTGRTGLAAVLPPGPRRYVISQDVIGVTLRSGVSPYFVVAFLNSDYGALQFRRIEKGNVQAHLDLATTRAVRVPLPDRRIQNYISAKVELAELCRTASSRSWAAATDLLGTALGVPLTPDTFEVKSADNVSGSDYQVTSLCPVVAVVSPERLVGAIGAQFFTPRRAKAILVIEQSGLAAKRLSALADRFTKRVSADEVQARSLSYVGLAQVDSFTGFVSPATDEQPSSSSACFGSRDILFSKLRPYLNKVAICPEHLEEVAGSTELVTYRAKPGVDPYYVFFVLKSPLVLNQVIDITSGSTHPRVDPDLIDDVLVPMAEASVQKRIGQLAHTALELMRRATLLVEEAKADVEALIEGTLDVQAILAGTLKAPTTDDVPELAEDGA